MKRIITMEEVVFDERRKDKYFGEERETCDIAKIRDFQLSAGSRLSCISTSFPNRGQSRQCFELNPHLYQQSLKSGKWERMGSNCTRQVKL